MTTTMETLSNWRSWLPGGRSPATGSQTIEPGALFVCEGPTKSIELAHVIDTATDEFGIPHVRFLLGYRLQDRIMQAGERTLAREIFSRRFNRRIEETAE